MFSGTAPGVRVDILDIPVGFGPLCLLLRVGHVLPGVSSARLGKLGIGVDFWSAVPEGQESGIKLVTSGCTMAWARLSLLAGSAAPPAGSDAGPCSRRGK